MQQIKKYAVAFLGTALFCVIWLLFVKFWMDFLKKDNWADQYLKNLEYNFDETAVNKKIKKKEWKKIASQSYEGTYDFNRDGQAETLRISFSDSDSSCMAQIDFNDAQGLQIALESGNVQRAFTIVGIYHECGTYLAALESVYDDEGGMGKLKCQIYRYQNGSFVRTDELLYMGMIDERGIMTDGIIESRCMEKEFSYHAKEYLNEYVYYRSVVFADMKDLGIRLPSGTEGKFETSYKRNVKGIFNVIVE